MTTYATVCSENALLRFSCRMTDFARYAKENFSISCKALLVCAKTAKEMEVTFCCFSERDAAVYGKLLS